MQEWQGNFSPAQRRLVDVESAGQRIDNYLLRVLKGVPRSYVYRIIRKGEVRVNRGRIRADYRLQAGDEVRIPPLRRIPAAKTAAPGAQVLSRLEKAILYEDRRLLAINKPSGMAVHGGSGLSFGVIEALRHLRPEAVHWELVHRLDRETSGCLLVAKRRSVLRQLHELLRSGQMDKRYLAMLGGDFPGRHREVRAALRTNTRRGGERVVRVDPMGKAARTRFKRLRRLRDGTLVEAHLLTGRTHQIRVHAAHLGCPIVGDEKYGTAGVNALWRRRGVKRLFLHAHRLEFRWPGSGETFRLVAPLEAGLEEIVERYAQETAL